METVKYKNYTVTRFDSGTIQATKNGIIASPTKPLLRELAKELNIDIESAYGNSHNTRQLGILVMREINESQSKKNTQPIETIDISKTIDDKYHSQQSNKNSSYISFLDRIKQIIKRLSLGKHIKSSRSTLEELIAYYFSRNKYGFFYLNKGEKIEKVLTENDVPNQYGVYIIYSVEADQEDIIYIGKAGTMTTDGEFKSQGIKNRLKAVGTNNVPRNIYFQDVMKEFGFNKLKFVWIVTFDDSKKELPAYSEAKLIQFYYDHYHKLPMLNKSI